MKIESHKNSTSVPGGIPPKVRKTTQKRIALNRLLRAIEATFPKGDVRLQRAVLNHAVVLMFEAMRDGRIKFDELISPKKALSNTGKTYFEQAYFEVRENASGM
jgi:hypothetical protein